MRHRAHRSETLIPASSVCVCVYVCVHRFAQVWDTAGPGCIRWHAASAGAAHIGAVAENSLLQTALLQSIQRQGCMHLPDASVPTTTASGSNDSQGLKFELGLTCLWPVTLDSVRLPSAVPSSSPASRTDSQAASQQESSASSAGQQGSQVSEAQGQGGEASMSGVSSADALAQLEFKVRLSHATACLCTGTRIPHGPVIYYYTRKHSCSSRFV